MIAMVAFSFWLSFSDRLFSDQFLSSQAFLPSGTAIALPTGDMAYAEETDTYYLLFKFEGSPPYSWEHASVIIKGYRHQGREGFLAKIKDSDTHYQLANLMAASPAPSAWIGLEIVCAQPHYSEWNDGTSLDQQEFRAWAPGATEAIRTGCRRAGSRLPVFYQKTDIGLRWMVAATRANQAYILVAFPPASSPPAQ